MLQDLCGERLYNEFAVIRPSDEDTALCFFEKDILIRRDEDDYLYLPRVCDIGDSENFRYLFRIGEKRYFLYTGGKHLQLEGFEYENARTIRDIKSKDICFAVITGWHLFSWYENNRFCGKCGSKTVHDDKERMLKCEKCGNMIYPKISPAVIIAVCNGDKLLLSKYAGRNFTRYALLAGYTEIGETIEETVKREVMEEVGLSVKNIRYYKSQPWGVDGNVLMGFFCDLDGEDKIKIDEQELSMADWFERGNIPAKDDGFSLTREMIRIFEEGKEPK